MNIKKIYSILADQPKFRLQQINHLLFQDLITDWDQATVLPKDLRESLAKECSLEIEAETKHLANNSTKAMIVLEDGLRIETVLINNYDGRNTVCVSSQVGCSLGCAFCATGAMGFKRNLTAQEIFEQVLFFARRLKLMNQKIDNIVFMGMGEPLLNLDNVLDAIKTFNDPKCFNLGIRRISISTAGIKAGIEKLKNSGLQINLALSLHAADDKLRAELMPVHRSTNLKELMGVIKDYAQTTNRQIMFEYIMLKDVNDSEIDAEKLASLLDDHRLYLVNLINYNQTGKFTPSTSARIRNFKNILMRAGLKVTVRDSHGQDINAACGQLATE